MKTSTAFSKGRVILVTETRSLTQALALLNELVTSIEDGFGVDIYWDRQTAQYDAAGADTFLNRDPIQ